MYSGCLASIEFTLIDVLFCQFPERDIFEIELGAFLIPPYWWETYSVSVDIRIVFRTRSNATRKPVLYEKYFKAALLTTSSVLLSWTDNDLQEGCRANGILNPICSPGRGTKLLWDNCFIVLQRPPLNSNHNWPMIYQYATHTFYPFP